MDHSEATPSCCCNPSQQEVKTDKPLMTIRKTSKSLPSVLMSILIAFFPKCPMCWAVYMSMFGSLGLARLPYMPWLLPVLFFFMAIHLFILFRKAQQKGYLPFLLSLTGATIILLGRGFFPAEKWLLISGMVLIISGSLFNSFSGNIRIHFNLFKRTF